MINKKIKEILGKEIITSDEFEYLCDYLDYENCGNSGKYYNKTWFSFKFENNEYNIYVEEE